MSTLAARCCARFWRGRQNHSGWVKADAGTWVEFSVLSFGMSKSAAAAIEDGAVLARALSEMSAEPARAMRRYESERRRRTARSARASAA